MSNCDSETALENELQPLCVDLDGTLLKTDTLAETIITALNHWIAWILMFFWLIRGRAWFKSKLASRAPIDASLLPYNADLVQYLREEKKRGRMLVLITAANERIANAVGSHVGLFNEVIASGDEENLKGRRKAEALRERFGDKGFSYAGDSRADLHVWKYASSGILVNTSSNVSREAAKLTNVTHQFHDKSSKGLSLLKAFRPHQWVKNILVFVPIITANALNDFNAFINASLLFIAFCCTASSVYLINDLCDLRADRNHHSKRMRPFASGCLPIFTGIAAIPILVSAGFAVAFATRVPSVILLLLSYFVLSNAYSMKIKRLPLADVFVLALLYTIRLFSGGLAARHEVSSWLLAFSGFLFLSLALVKRVGELKQKAQKGQIEGRGYSFEDLATLQTFGIASAFLSSLVLALYIQSEAAAILYIHMNILFLTVPVTLFWLCRLWLATARGYMHDDPIVYATKDKISWAVGLLIGLILLLAKVRF